LSIQISAAFEQKSSDFHVSSPRYQMHGGLAQPSLGIYGCTMFEEYGGNHRMHMLRRKVQWGPILLNGGVDIGTVLE
jgi:hypothetical protein